MATVLIVEDDPLSSALLARMLGDAGYATVCAASAGEAWKRLGQEVLVDMVFLDSVLEESSGLELLRWIREDPVFSGLSVCICSAHSSRQSVLKYLRLGIRNFLVKPYCREKILNEARRGTAQRPFAWLFDVPEHVCLRLGLSHREHRALLRKIAGGMLALLQRWPEPSACLGDAEAPERIGGLRENAVSLGFGGLAEVCAHLREARAAGDEQALAAGLEHLARLARICGADLDGAHLRPDSTDPGAALKGLPESPNSELVAHSARCPRPRSTGAEMAGQPRNVQG